MSQQEDENLEDYFKIFTSNFQKNKQSDLSYEFIRKIFLK